MSIYDFFIFRYSPPPPQLPLPLGRAASSSIPSEWPSARDERAEPAAHGIGTSSYSTSDKLLSNWVCVRACRKRRFRGQYLSRGHSKCVSRSAIGRKRGWGGCGADWQAPRSEQSLTFGLTTTPCSASSMSPHLSTTSLMQPLYISIFAFRSVTTLPSVILSTAVPVAVAVFRFVKEGDVRSVGGPNLFGERLRHTQRERERARARPCECACVS